MIEAGLSELKLGTDPNVCSLQYAQNIPAWTRVIWVPTTEFLFYFLVTFYIRLWYEKRKNFPCSNFPSPHFSHLKMCNFTSGWVRTSPRGKLGIVVLLSVTRYTLHVAVTFSLDSFDEEIDWDFPVVDEYYPYNLSLLSFGCQCIPVDT